MSILFVVMNYFICLSNEEHIYASVTRIKRNKQLATTLQVYLSSQVQKHPSMTYTSHKMNLLIQNNIVSLWDLSFYWSCWMESLECGSSLPCQQLDHLMVVISSVFSITYPALVIYIFNICLYHQIIDVKYLSTKISLTFSISEAVWNINPL